MESNLYQVQGAGLGLRRVLLKSLVDSLEDQFPQQVGFMEVAPENWIDLGGAAGRKFASIADQVPITAHGLSLNIGGSAPLDEVFLQQVKKFLDQYKIDIYSDHLTYCADDGHLYDLMPIPFTEEAVQHVVERIRRVEEIIERPFVIENASYYAAPSNEMSEIDFINAVLKEADCQLLIDINNIYVNSINHSYDAEAFMKSLPGERIAYAHIAGHYNEAEDLIIDTHGADIIDPVWKLLEVAYDHFGVFPTLLERDFNIPPLQDLLDEVDRIVEIQQDFLKKETKENVRQHA